MVLFNHATREMTAKIVYYGPGLCGKTTNLLVIYDLLDEKNRGKMLSLATKSDRTLFFDLLPVDVGKVGAFNLKIQLYTVPGQVFYNETRKLVLKGADSVVFVADSQPSMVESTRESFENLLDNLRENNLDPNDIPIIIQYNKRDIPGVLPVDELQDKLGFEGYPYTEAAAVKGEGVMETFKLITKITAKHLITKLGGKPGSRPDIREPKFAMADKSAKSEKAEKKVKKSEARAEAEKPPLPPPPDFSASPSDFSANPFASSMPFGDQNSSDTVTPFPEASVDGTYEKVEEVSLEKLLEGRERPATMSGNIPIPVAMDEVEPLPEESLVEEGSVAIAVEEAPPAYEEAAPYEETPAYEEATPYEEPAHLEAPAAGNADVQELARQVAELRAELAEVRAEQQRLLDGLRRGAAEFSRIFTE